MTKTSLAAGCWLALLAGIATPARDEEPADYVQNGRLVEILPRYRKLGPFVERRLVRDANGKWEPAPPPSRPIGRSAIDAALAFHDAIPGSFSTGYHGYWHVDQPFVGRIELRNAFADEDGDASAPVLVFDLFVSWKVASVEWAAADSPILEIPISPGYSRSFDVVVRDVVDGDLDDDWEGEYVLRIEGNGAKAFTFADGSRETCLRFVHGKATATIRAGAGRAAVATLVGFDPRQGFGSDASRVSPIRIPLRRRIRVA